MVLPQHNRRAAARAENGAAAGQPARRHDRLQRRGLLGQAALRRIAAGLALGYACMVTAGCGCGSRHAGGNTAKVEAVRERLKQQAQDDQEKAKQDEQEAERLRKVAETRKAEEKRKREEEAARRRAEAQQRLASTVRGPDADARTAAPTPKEFPESFADWKPEDYTRARSEGSPRFPEAVADLGRSSAGDEGAAALLLRLLATETTGSLSAATQQEAVRVIVQALADNGTPAAWRGIEGLLDGTTFAVDGESARRTALAVLAERGDSTGEKILLAALLKSSKSSSPTVRDLTRTFLDDYGSKTSERFRVVLAGYSVDAQMPWDQRDLLQEFLLEPEPKNLGAQIVIYRAPATPLALRRQLRADFLRQSSLAIGLLTGVPQEIELPRRSAEAVTRPSGEYQTAYASRRRTAAPPRSSTTLAKDRSGAVDLELPARVARYLWSGEMTAHLAGELYQVDDLADQAGLVALAATIPVDPMRASLHETVKRNWQDGPNDLESTGVFEHVIIDPGMLVMLKMMPRADSGAEDASRSAPWLNKRRTKDKYRPPGLAEVREMVGDVEADWMRVGGQLVLRLSERFEAAALAQAPSAEGGAAVARRTSAGYVRLPFDLHEGARVVTQYELTWPNDLSDAACRGSVGPIRVCHVRIEEQNRYAKVLAYYRHQIQDAEAHLSSQGAWFDGLIHRPESNTQVSFDVLIIRDRIQGTPDNQDEKLRIDVLMVEIRDPSRPQ